MNDEEHDTKINQSDEQARRLVDITLTLMTSQRPVSSTRIRELHYPDTTWDSFRRMFSRDRQRLAVCGVVVRRMSKPPAEGLWQIDEESSFVSHETLSPREALILDVACSQLAADGSFPLADDLRIALGKIDRTFVRNTPIIPVASRHLSQAARRLESCALQGHAADVAYTHADGQEVSRTIAVYGMFSFHGHTYVVGPQLDAKGQTLEQSIRTYRLDRFVSATEHRGITYRIPLDFDITDYVVLPFQIGPTSYYALFSGPTGVLHSIMRRSEGRTELVHLDGNAALMVAVSSEEDASSWAIAEGLRPLSPPSLVKTWKSDLRRSLER